MNNEPVAYVDKIWIERPDLVMSQQLDIGRLFMRSGKEIKNYIPLYTHPAPQTMQILEDGRIVPIFKELTDEEINWLAKAYSTMEGELNAPAFARAILRKAQEK